MVSKLKVYYYKCADILKDYLPYIPQIQLTNAKGYMGQIVKKSDTIVIRLSKWNLDCGRFWEQEDIIELIDTICHEFAHMFFWEHGEDHTKMTKAMKQCCLSQLKIEYLNEKVGKYYG